MQPRASNPAAKPDATLAARPPVAPGIIPVGIGGPGWATEYPDRHHDHRDQEDSKTRYMPSDRLVAFFFDKFTKFNLD